MHRFTQILAVSLACLTLAPTAVAVACPPTPLRTIRNLDASRSDLRIPMSVKSTREEWALDATWFSVKPRVTQWLYLKNGLQFFGVSFSKQETPTIEAFAPEDRGWRYIQDPESTTQSCRMVGQSAWQPPKIFVKVTAKAIRLAAASQHTVGDVGGCILSPLWGVRDCPLVTMMVPRLKKPVGNRPIQLEYFA